jgi:hypothetical protein
MELDSNASSASSPTPNVWQHGDDEGDGNATGNTRVNGNEAGEQDDEQADEDVVRQADDELNDINRFAIGRAQII